MPKKKKPKESNVCPECNKAFLIILDLDKVIYKICKLCEYRIKVK